MAQYFDVSHQGAFYPDNRTEEPRTTTSSAKGAVLPWVQARKGEPYFFTEDGMPWTPIGQNDAITWPELQGLFRRKDLAGVDQYLGMLASHGVTCLRLMLEYSQGRHRYFEKPPGQFPHNMVQLWDDLFQLCAKHGLRILLTPYDTFWMWLQWKHHPYNKVNGGPCAKRSQWLLCPDTRNAIKQRLLFATRRWGGSGVLFAWDLWNEIHPAHAGNSVDIFSDFIADVGSFLRQEELRLHGRAHPQTVSIFGPVLYSHPESAAAIFRHPVLDFASTHFYESKTIDHPRNTVDAAISTGRLTAEALKEIEDCRPFFDSEHGPIHSFKDRRITLPEPFDDEYFRHIQWAHFASGAAGGGMRWPNRNPHTLTAGMRKAQQALSRFLPLVRWEGFNRQNWNGSVATASPSLVPFACGNETQAILWLLRRDSIGKNGMLRQDAPPVTTTAQLPLQAAGHYRVCFWNTKEGKMIREDLVVHPGAGMLSISLPPVATDMAVLVQL